MQTTMDLLDAALQRHPVPYWTEALSVSRNTLHTAKARGNLSPAIAGSLAEVMGENVQEWVIRAALESERDSACKERMLRRFADWRKR